MGTTVKAAGSSRAKAATTRPTAKAPAPKMVERRALAVVAQASYPPSGTVLNLHVDVRDSAGVPVKGLGKADFHVLQMPGGVFDLPVTIVHDLGAADSKRSGLYNLVFNAWSAPNAGLIAYRVHVKEGGNVGVAMTSIVAR